MYWKRAFCQIKIPAKIVRYGEEETGLVIDIWVIASIYHPPITYLLWMYSHFTAPEICHLIFKTNGFFLPFSLSFFLLVFSPVIMLVRFLFRDFFLKSCVWSTLLLVVSKSSKNLPPSSSICSSEKEAGILFLTCILVRGSRWTPVSLVQVGWCNTTHSCASKLVTKAEVYLKSLWVTQLGMCWPTHGLLCPGTHVAAHWGLRLKTRHVCVAK